METLLALALVAYFVTGYVIGLWLELTNRLGFVGSNPFEGSRMAWTFFWPVGLFLKADEVLLDWLRRPKTKLDPKDYEVGRGKIFFADIGPDGKPGGWRGQGEGTLKVEPGEARVWQIWSEGYQATGERASATFHGQYSAATWDEAVKQWRDSLEDEYSRSCVSKISGGGWVYWGCRLFDNEADARRAFG